MKKMVLAMCVFLVTMGLAMSVAAYPVIYSNGDYHKHDLGSTTGYGFDMLDMIGISNTVDVFNSPVIVDMSDLSFTSGPTNRGFVTDTFFASWILTINGETKIIGQPGDMVVGSIDTLHLYAGTPIYFPGVVVTLLPLTSGADNAWPLVGIWNGTVQATMQAVPEPATMLLLGLGLLGVAGIRRFKK